ncbi:lantibiotic dehydratase [Hyalangium sp.]|uniref:lantibiotic dehydratase n=1 Tax=Hyalangium sp. TaxID=2028555 RepID=UPI002D4117FB|nr:lantibiotic dehydratase [Hyalangium sp.]HYH98228.1 lantibiotic dehydratase [Hyalangium sp.]
MKESRSGDGIITSGFFALRTPLLPFDVLGAWSEGLEAAAAPPAEREAALARDRAKLRERLRQRLADPVVREALFVASPVLMESLPLWESEPDSEGGRKVERTLVRYFARMAGRATPFGLFAGHSVGRIAEQTRLAIPGREAFRRHTRLDMDYVGALVEQVRKAPEVRGALRYVPNSSLYHTAGRLRFLEMRLRGRQRSYHLVAVEPTSYLEATLERARGGATLAALAAALGADEPEVSLEEALSYVETLVTEQLLLPTWAPTLTGSEPVPHLIDVARGIAPLGEVCERLSAAHGALARLDAQPLGRPPQEYQEVARLLEALPAPVELPRLFQVDLYRKLPEATLSPAVAEELLRAAQVLRRLTPQRADSHPLEEFRTRFLERYEGRAVPLVEALDEESGIGSVLAGGVGSGTGPLLAGFVLPRGRGGDLGRWTERSSHLLRRLESIYRTGGRVLELTEEDLSALEYRRATSLPDAFGVVATLVADSAQAVDEGRFQVLLENVHGPSAALYLGRFCHGDPALEEALRGHMRAEEALRPEALFAEIVHLPQDRMGNVICRPLLRQHDIVFLGESGASGEARISISDLWVSVEGERIVLRSRRLGREVVPRMSNAHNYSTYGLGLYRFLGLLQHEDQPGLNFRWGPLAQAPFLPRVVHGRAVLSLACWNLESKVLKQWGEASGAQRFEAVQRFRREERLPRWVCLKDEDNQLPLDLDNVLCVETLVQAVKGRPRATLEELFPGPEGLCVRGEDGGYVHELVVPFVRQATSVPARSVAPATAATPVRRSFPPGSEWLYAKLYGGPATLDRLLGGPLGEAVRQARASGAADRWFFIRYKDPETHVRLRFHGPPARLEAEVWPALRQACASLMEEGSGWRVQLDTYERELERYGGPAGIELAEELFAADSEAVLDITRELGGDAGAELRWRLVLKGMDAMMDDLGFSLEQKAAIARRNREGFGAEFRVDRGFEDQLSQRYRRESRALEALLFGASAPDAPWSPGLLAFEQRSARLRTLAERLRHVEREGQLREPVERLVDSFLHMHANRMLTDEHRPQELILHDFLARLYRSRLARLKKGT